MGGDGGVEIEAGQFATASKVDEVLGHPGLGGCDIARFERRQDVRMRIEQPPVRFDWLVVGAQAGATGADLVEHRGIGGKEQRTQRFAGQEQRMVLGGLGEKARAGNNVVRLKGGDPRTRIPFRGLPECRPTASC